MKTVFMVIFIVSAIMLTVTGFIAVPKLIKMKNDYDGGYLDSKESTLILLITIMQIVFMVVGLLGVYVL